MKFRSNYKGTANYSGSANTPKKPIPYRFVGISPSAAITDAPLWRDGSSKEKRLSGELLLTLTALTPLIVGNHQHKVDEKHSILVPQMLEDGRVLLAASSLKGMLRSTLASLLNAPMSRVTEHHYTYRPNLGFGGEDAKREVRAAIVHEVQGEGKDAQVTLHLLPPAASVVFVREDAEDALSKIQPLRPGEPIKRLVQGVDIPEKIPAIAAASVSTSTMTSRSASTTPSSPTAAASTARGNLPKPSTKKMARPTVSCSFQHRTSVSPCQ